MTVPPARPVISIIMPAYNVAHYVTEAIDSVLAQTLTDWELIIVNDGSTDDTGARIKQFDSPRIQPIEQPNAGVSSARNRGIAVARGEWIAFLDADDRWRPDALERLLAGARSEPSTVVAYGEGVVMDATGRVTGPEAAPLLAARPSGFILRDLLKANFVVNPGVVLTRADALRTVGGYCADLRMAEDWELWTRVAKQGNWLYIGGQPILEYRQRPDSATREWGPQIHETMRAIDRVFTAPENTERLSLGDLRRLRRHRIAGAWAFSGAECLKSGDWRKARSFFFQSLRRRPLSLREWILLAFAIVGTLPHSIRKRIK